MKSPFSLPGIVLLFLAIPIVASAQYTTFTSVFNLSGSEILSNGAVQTDDSAYYVAGEQDGDALIIKLDAYGYNLWQKQYAFPGSGSFFTRIMLTHDNQFILVGTNDCYSSISDILCVKLNQEGDTVWARSIDFGFSEFGTYVQETSDHGFIISGFSQVYSYNETRMVLVRLDSAGHLLWGYTFLGDPLTVAHSVREAPDGGFYVIGDMRNITGWEVIAILLKLTPDGDLEWSTCIPSSNGWSRGYDVLIRDSSLYWMIEIYNGTLIVKTDMEGNIDWTRKLDLYSGGAFVNYFVQAPKLHFTHDGGFICVATGQFTFMVKTDSLGMAEWEADVFLESSDVVPALDGGYLVVGNGPIMGVELGPTLDPQIGLIKTDSLGASNDYCIYSFWSDSDSLTLSFTPISLARDTGVTFTEEHPQINPATMIHYTGCVASTGSIDDQRPDLPILSVSPNPSDGHILLQVEPETSQIQGVEVFNTTGKLVWSSQPDQRLPLRLDLSFLPSGIYLLQSTTEGIQQAQRLVIIH